MVTVAVFRFTGGAACVVKVDRVGAAVAVVGTLKPLKPPEVAGSENVREVPPEVAAGAAELTADGS